MTQHRQQRAGAAQARVSGLANDPRIARNARSAGATPVTLGKGLRYDREGKLTLEQGPGVPRLPDEPTLADVVTYLRNLDRSLRTAGPIPE